MRVRTGATIARARLPIQIDAGFGDVITPEAIGIEYPALLEAPAPILRAYPPETVVAEKTEAIVSLGIANNWMIVQTFTFEFATLADVIQQTFERRRTFLPEQVPIGLSDGFSLEREAQWRAFLARYRIVVAPTSLVQVINDQRSFLQPVLARVEVTSWPPGGPWTEVVDR